LAEQLRQQFPSLRVAMNCGGGSMKAQFKRADKSQAQLAIIIGETELASNTVAVKHLRKEQQQTAVSLDELNNYLTAIFL
jgi:histidyl-tRNA synthetase